MNKYNRPMWPARQLALPALALLCAAGAMAPAQALQPGRDKLLLTGGVSTIDGAAGGGLTPWAVTGTYASTNQFGITANASVLRTQDYGLKTYGVAVSVDDRVEVSLGHQDLDTEQNLAPLGLPGLHLKQDIVGVKVRLFGDAVLDSDTWVPQLAVGLLHKKADPGALGPTLTGALGAKTKGTEFYVSATKLFLASGILVNGTLRVTAANQNGLLGFDGAQGRGKRVYPEFSIAWLANSQLAFGAEWRGKPDNQNDSALGAGALKEDDWADLFVAWAPSKHFSLTLAWVDLGRIAPAVQPKRQSGAYVSAQVGF
jgi:hypothetical protein